jgi:hypothetical protein
MPRKPIGDEAMTATERVRRYRERQRAARPDASLTDRQKLAQARAEIGRLRQQLAAAVSAKKPASTAGAAPAAEIAALRAEIEQLRKTGPSDQKRPDMDLSLASKRVRELEQIELPRLRQRIRTLEAERDAAKPRPDPDSLLASQIKGLRTQNRNLRAELAHVREFHKAELLKHGRMDFTTKSRIAKVLHPDAMPGDADREAAYKAFTAWASDSKAASRR